MDERAMSEFNFILLADRSGSMGETDMPGGKSRWAAMQETMLCICRDLGKIDDDGLDLLVFGGSTVQEINGVTASNIKQRMESSNPMGGTPTAEAVQKAFSLAKKQGKKAVVLVFTDGEPNDKDALKQAIVKQANSQEADDQCTVLFILVGSGYDKKYWSGLDDELASAKFDIVDVKTLAEMEEFSSVVAAIEAAIAG